MSTRKESWLAARRWLSKRADDVAVAFMGTMFVVFVLQIAFRYLLTQPLSWAEEVTLLCWLWGVLWGAAFILSDDEEIRFDIIYGAVPVVFRRAFVVISGVSLILLLLISLPATWHYVTFMKRERTASLHIPLNYLYSIYLIFSLACIVRHCRLVWAAIRGTLPVSNSIEPADVA
jgi:TRAP-type C4-dicarboxylate transport system permease small subunit